MYLLDSNVLVELLLQQDNADQVEELLSDSTINNLHLTDFALHSISVILIRYKLYDLLSSLISDIQSSDRIRIIQLDLSCFPNIISAVKRYNLDFDDAYQYVAAEKHNLTIVSFDKDFDRTDRGRKIPSEVLQG